MAVDESLASVELWVEERPELLVPYTGELVDLREPGQVARALQSVREAKTRLDEVRGMLETVLRLEARRQGTKTLHLDGLDAVVSGGEKVDYDVERLMLLLRHLGCPEERIVAAAAPVVTYKLNHAVLRQLAAGNPEYRDAIAACRTVEPAAWRVTVK